MANGEDFLGRLSAKSPSTCCVIFISLPNNSGEPTSAGVSFLFPFSPESRSGKVAQSLLFAYVCESEDVACLVFSFFYSVLENW